MRIKIGDRWKWKRYIKRPPRLTIIDWDRSVVVKFKTSKETKYKSLRNLYRRYARSYSIYEI